ncbi:PrgI family protein [Candidatus Parcubacteria bacterium]|nr:PrgI family protein [Candidatus Parcubacteria bacterium]
MRFQVPQFIEVEDKIFGPLTFKQFVYLAGAAGLCFIVYFFLPHFVAFILFAPIVALSLALAFYKVNNKPFINMLESMFQYGTGSKLYIWKKEERTPEAAKVEKLEAPSVYVPKLSDSKLKDLTWSLDIKESLNPVTKNRQ